MVLFRAARKIAAPLAFRALRRAAPRTAKRIRPSILKGTGLIARAFARLPTSTRTAIKILERPAEFIFRRGVSPFIRTRPRRIATTLIGGALITSPRLRKKAVKTIRDEPLLLVSPLLVAGKKLGEVGEAIAEGTTPKDLLAIGGAAGLIGAGALIIPPAIRKIKAIRAKKDTVIPTPLPTQLAPSAATVGAPIVGKVPTAATEIETIKKKEIPSIRITNNPKINVILQNSVI